MEETYLDIFLSEVGAVTSMKENPKMLLFYTNQQPTTLLSQTLCL
jgi:hypothetical protein